MTKNDGWTGLRIRVGLHTQITDMLENPTVSQIGIKNTTQLVDMILRKGMEYLQKEILDNARRKELDSILEEKNILTQNIHKMAQEISGLSAIKLNDAVTIEKLESMLEIRKKLDIYENQQLQKRNEEMDNKIKQMYARLRDLSLELYYEKNPKEVKSSS